MIINIAALMIVGTIGWIADALAIGCAIALATLALQSIGTIAVGFAGAAVVHACGACAIGAAGLPAGALRGVFALTVTANTLLGIWTVAGIYAGTVIAGALCAHTALADFAATALGGAGAYAHVVDALATATRC